MLDSPSSFRHQAASLLQLQGADSSVYAGWSEAQLLNELHLQRLELELQNAALQHTSELLQEEQRRSRDLFRFMPMPYLCLDRTGQVLECNQAALHLLGLSMMELRQQSFFRFLPQPTRDTFVRFLSSVFEYDLIQTSELSLLTARQQLLRVEVSAQSYFHADEQVKRCRFAITDLSRIAQLQAQLQDSQLHVQVLGKGGNDWVYWTDENKSLRYISHVAETITGYTVDEFFARPELLQQIVVPEDAEAFQVHKHQLDAHGQRTPTEFRIRHKQGHTVWISHTCLSVFDEKGQFRGIRGCNRDISQSKVEYFNFHAANHLLHATLNIAGVGICFTDEQGYLVECNAMAEALIGMSKEHCLHRYCGGLDWDIVRPNLSPMPSSEYAAVSALRRHHHVNDQLLGIRKPDGLISWLSVSAHPLDWPGYGVVIRFRDVSVEHAYQSELAQKNNEIVLVNQKFLAHFEELEMISEHLQQVNTALAESESKLNSILQAANVGIAVFDTSYQFSFVNETWLQLTGYACDELNRMLPFAFVLPKSRQELQQALKSLESNSPVHSSAFLRSKARFFTKDGRLIWVDLSLSVLAGLDSWPAQYIAVITDITRQSEAENHLQESEERLSLYVNSTSDVVFTLDTQQRHTGIFGNWAQRSGLQPEFFLGRTAAEILGEEAADIHTRANAVALQGQNVVYEWSSIAFEDITYMQTSLSPLVKDGQVVGLIGVGRDISPLKVAQLQLEHSRQNLKEAQQIGNIGHWEYLGGPQNLLLLSEQACRILELPAEELQLPLEHLLQWLLPDDAELLRQVLFTEMHNEQFFDHIHRILLPSGKLKYLRTRLAPLYSELGTPNHRLGTMQDISKLKKNELELIEQRSRLQELNATKDKFFSIISHDLRSPFNAILGFSELLLNKHQHHSPENINEYLSLIHQSAENAYQLLENLLAWARTQTDKMECYPSSIELHKLVQDLAINCQPAAHAKRIVLNNHVQPCCTVWADRHMLETTLRNLITNAIKFNLPNGEIHIEASALDAFVQIRVRDSGIGMSPEKLKSLFRIGETKSQVGTAGERGTGLGLLLCKEFVEKNGGTLAAESIQGKGSSFFFTVPIHLQQS